MPSVLTRCHKTLCRLLLALPLLAAVVSCGVPSDRFRLEGRFKNLNQGEFYLYNLRDGTKDTLHISDGRFVYDVELTDTATFVLMFPNFSELPIFAQPGSEVTMEGDVSHLKETELKGTADNEQMTAFRLATNELAPPEMRKAAEDYIRDHAASSASLYLLRKYFVQDVTADYTHALELCSVIRAAQPTCVELLQLEKQLRKLENMQTGISLPHFSAKATNGKAVSDSLLKSKVNAIMVWATWNFDSQNAIRQLKMLYDEHKRDISVVTVCMDASPSEGKHVFMRDSLSWPNICDGRMWESPVVEQLGIAFVPDNIITDAKGKIVGRSLKINDLKKKVQELLGEE